MTFALAANIVLDVIVFSVIVGMLAWAIRASHPERTARQTRTAAQSPAATTARPATTPRPATTRAAHARGARSHGHGSFERIEA